MNLTHRSYTKELLASEDIPFSDIKRNMQELNFINTWLGGHKITISGLQSLIENRKEIVVCEIGSGGGDNLTAIVRWCNKRNIIIKCIGIDIKDECIFFARQNKFLSDCTEWICADYKEVQFKK